MIYPLKESQLDFCCWCGEHRGVDYLELCSLDENGELWYPDPHAKRRPIAFVSHASCENESGYPIALESLILNPARWQNHIAKKSWDDPVYQTAFVYLSSRPLPQTRQNSFQVMPANDYRGTYTYFIQAEAGGPIKIGKAHNPIHRLKSLQTGNSKKLRIIRLIKGDVEGQLHERFEHLRQLGEWFKCDPELNKFLFGDTA